MPKPGLSGLGSSVAGPRSCGGGRPGCPLGSRGFAHSGVRPTRLLVTRGLGAGGGRPRHLRRVSRGRPALPHPARVTTATRPARRPPVPLRGLGLLSRGPLTEGEAPRRTRRWFQTAAAGLFSRCPAKRGGLFCGPQRLARCGPANQPLQPGGRLAQDSRAYSAGAAGLETAGDSIPWLVPAEPHEVWMRMLRACPDEP